MQMMQHIASPGSASPGTSAALLRLFAFQQLVLVLFTSKSAPSRVDMGEEKLGIGHFPRVNQNPPKLVGESLLCTITLSFTIN